MSTNTQNGYRSYIVSIVHRMHLWKCQFAVKFMLHAFLHLRFAQRLFPFFNLFIKQAYQKAKMKNAQFRIERRSTKT